MKSKTTGIWFLIAASLLAFIWFYKAYMQPAAPVVAPLLPGLRTADVTGIQVSPAGALEIGVVRTNGGWQLVKPLAYPAQVTAVEALADALGKIVPVTRISAAEMRAHTNADAEFGFESPQFRLLIKDDDQWRQVLVGNKTAPGDQVFIRVVGVEGVFVTEASWLQLLPHSANDWRDTALIDGTGSCNWIVITNGSKAMEFRRDGTNQLWRMIRPLQARADSARLASAFEQLRSGRVAQFITDDPRADLSTYGLQPPELDVWLGQGTNLTAGVEVGKSLPASPALVFARRTGWNAVVAANRDAFAGWRGAVNDYRDPHLFTPATPVAEIEVRGDDNFTLQRRGSNDWTVAGEKFPADVENVQAFLRFLANLRVSEFVKDVVTPSDLEGFGLTKPSRQVILRSRSGDTNSLLAQLQFGTVETNRVFVKRTDEDFVYAIATDDYNNLVSLYGKSYEFRDRHIWNFSEKDVAQVTLNQSGKTRQIIRTGENKWSLAPGSQGILKEPPAIEETVHRLGQLTAFYWMGRNITDPEKDYGLNPKNLSITIELKNGEKFTVAFGTEEPRLQTALAAVTLNGERWAFIFPPVLYQFVTTYLTIPPNTP